MSDCLVVDGIDGIPIRFFTEGSFLTWLPTQKDYIQAWARAINFNGSVGPIQLVPDGSGKLLEVWCGLRKSSWSC